MELKNLLLTLKAYTRIYLMFTAMICTSYALEALNGKSAKHLADLLVPEINFQDGNLMKSLRVFFYN